jgi:hypothetical protein
MGISQEAWDKIMNPLEQLDGTMEWKRYSSLVKEIKGAETAFSQRNMRFTPWMRPDWLQDRRDKKIVRKLERILVDTNNTLRQHRKVHGVSPFPTYFLPEMSDDSAVGVKIEHRYKKDDLDYLGNVPAQQIGSTLPSKRERILIVPYTTDLKTLRPFCGFCGDVYNSVPDKAPRWYGGASVMRLGDRVYFCEKPECETMAVANYLWQRVIESEIASLMGAFGHRLLEQQEGRSLTPTQANYISEQRLQEFIRNCVGK